MSLCALLLCPSSSFFFLVEPRRTLACTHERAEDLDAGLSVFRRSRSRPVGPRRWSDSFLRPDRSSAWRDDGDYDAMRREPLAPPRLLAACSLTVYYLQLRPPPAAWRRTLLYICVCILEHACAEFL